MKTYTLTIKSHADYPDYVQTVQAGNQQEATIKFMRGLSEWTEQEIQNFIEEN